MSRNTLLAAEPITDSHDGSTGTCGANPRARLESVLYGTSSLVCGAFAIAALHDGHSPVLFIWLFMAMVCLGRAVWCVLASDRATTWDSRGVRGCYHLRFPRSYTKAIVTWQDLEAIDVLPPVKKNSEAWSVVLVLRSGQKMRVVCAPTPEDCERVRFLLAAVRRSAFAG